MERRRRGDKGEAKFRSVILALYSRDTDEEVGSSKACGRDERNRLPAQKTIRLPLGLAGPIADEKTQAVERRRE